MNANERAKAPSAHGDELLDRIGQLTRALRESMRELGLNKHVERAAEAIPDARDRLSYIAETTEAAAERALTAIEVAQPMQARLSDNAQALSSRWNEWPDALADRADVVALVGDTRAFLRELPEQSQVVSSQLHEIMMAQDFQDLTGQVVGKLIGVIHQIESQLIEVLIDHSDGANSDAYRKHAAISVADDGDGLMNGPQINPAGKTGIVTNQQQVDDLLDELGF